jgi:sugar/nucleoside kinase (ribokinase family)
LANNKKYDILVAGEINPDLVLRGDVVPEFGQVEKLVDSADLTVGSSSAIFACGAARLGLKVGFIGLCGDDLFGNFMLKEMSTKGVDISPVIIRKGGQTGLSVILANGNDRAILTHAGLIPAFTAADIPFSLLRNARHLHVASYFLQTGLQPGIEGLFDEARSLGLTTSLDPNWDPAESWQGFDFLLGRVDVFLPNEKEARSITRAETLHDALKGLAGKAGLAAVKCGEQGASGRKRDTEIHVPGLKMDVVDTVGAGDSFDAGFLYGYLNGWEFGKSLRLAVACGSLSTRAAGGVTSQPTLEEALKYARTFG